MSVESARRLYTVVLIVSVVIFLAHKIEDRFTDTPGKSCQSDHKNAWQCKFPGQIVSHKPWGVKTGCAVVSIYVVIGALVCILMSRVANNVAKSTRVIAPPLVAIVLFSLLWVAWGSFETHHIKKTYNRILKGKPSKRGTIFSKLFTKFIFFAYLPATLWLLSHKVG
jgi:hypothetical protein